MNNVLFIDQLKQEIPNKKELIDLFEYEINKKMYYYGYNFSFPYEKFRMKELINDFKEYILNIKNIIKYSVSNRKKTQKGKIISNAYFNFNMLLSEQGFTIVDPVFSSSFINNLKMLKYKNFIDQTIRCSLDQLLSEKTNKIIDEIKCQIKRNYTNCRAVILANDFTYFNKIIIQCCKERGIPTFIFLHGLPARYNKTENSLADYFIVWGEKIKTNYLEKGFNTKIIVLGHPIYSKKEANKKQLSSIDNVLVLGKAVCGVPEKLYEKNGSAKTQSLSDRSSSIIYLLQIERSLKELGVRKATLRLHPSENIKWYEEWLDFNFFTHDKQSLNQSLQSSTLVVGPASTVFLEAIFSGINYVVYEPLTEGGLDLNNIPLVPPFDFSDPRVVVAHTPAQLLEKLKKGATTDPNCLEYYIKTPFNLSELERYFNYD